MIRPVGVDHLYFRNGGVSPFFTEIIATERRVVFIHSETFFRDELAEFFVVVVAESFKDGYFFRFFALRVQGFGKIQRRFPRFYGVYDVFFDGGKLFFGKFSR